MFDAIGCDNMEVIELLLSDDNKVLYIWNKNINTLKEEALRALFDNYDAEDDDKMEGCECLEYLLCKNDTNGQFKTKIEIFNGIFTIEITIK